MSQPTNSQSISTADYQFHVPERLIPSLPSERRGERRDQARLAVVSRGNQTVQHSRFDCLPDFLRAGDALVVNDSLVIQDCLRGKSILGTVTLVLFGFHVDGWHAQVRPRTAAKRGLQIQIASGALRAVLVRPGMDGLWIVRFDYEGEFHQLLQRHGRRSAPALEYLKNRMDTYQNVYGSEPGSLEIPSAGLHFTTPLLERIERMGVVVVRITLHIGLSERYRHIHGRRVEDHFAPAEWFRVKSAAAKKINLLRRRGGRVIAVGTSVVRTLETAAEGTEENATVRAIEEYTDLFIYPGYRYKIVDAILTNLHQPRSTHLMLVSAFAGKELVLDAYRNVVRSKYRFDLFGDSMLVL